MRLVKSPNSLMVKEISPGAAALEEMEKGCSRMAKGELLNVSQAN